MSATFWKCVADALFLAIRNYHKRIMESRTLQRLVLRVGMFRLVKRAGASWASRTLLRVFAIYLRRGCHSVSFTPIGCGRPRIANEQKVGTPLFLLWLMIG